MTPNHPKDHMTKPETAAEPHRCPNCGPVEAVDLSAETVRGGRRLDRPTTDTALRQRIADVLDRLHETGAVYALDEPEQDRIADALLPLFAAERLRARADAEVDDTIHACPGRWGGPDCRCFDTDAAGEQA